MASFADQEGDSTPRPAGDFSPLIREGNMAGPGETNWILSGQLLVGGHPGLVSKSSQARNLEGILKEDINLFVCLQEELSGQDEANINSARSAGSNLVRKRNAYGLRYMSSCGPYLTDAKIVATRLRKSPNSIHFMHYPIKEANDAVCSDSDATATATRIIAAIAAGDRVYLQCSNGNGRSGTISALVLGIVHGLSSSEALTLVDTYRTHRHGIQGLAVETHQQRAQIHRLLSNTDWRNMVCTTTPKSASNSAMNQGTVEKVLEEIKGGLMRRGAYALIKLRRLLERRDYGKTGRINLYDLTEALRTLGLGVRDGDIVTIVRKFDASQVGTFDYLELLSALRGDMSNERLKVVREAFDKIRRGDINQVAIRNETYDLAEANLPNHVTLLQMQKHYRAKNVHEVKNGKVSEGEAMSNFLDTFFNAGVTDRQIVNFKDFVEYYTNISASFDTSQDRAFQLLVWDCWGLSGSDLDTKTRGPAGSLIRHHDAHSYELGGPGHSADGIQRDTTLSAQKLSQQQSNNSYSRPTRTFSNDPATTMESIRQELLKKKQIGGDFQKNNSLTTGGTNVEGLVNFVVALRSAARGSSNGVGGAHGSIDRASLHRVLAQSGGDSGALTRASIDALFDAFVNKRKSGDGRTVETHDVVDALCGDLSSTRMELVGQAFQSLDSNGTGSVHIRDVAKKYIAKKHPEVVSGRHTSDEIFFSFFDGFRKLCSSKDGTVSLDMFVDYYRVVSASFPDDNYFRILMWSVWELAGNSRLTQHAHHKSMMERATSGAGRHKPGPAHRARAFPVVDRTFHQQQMIDAAASHHPNSWEGRDDGKNSQSGNPSIGIVPNASPGKHATWADSPHMNHNPRSGTADATKRTYSSSVGKIIGTQQGGNYWNSDGIIGQQKQQQQRAYGGGVIDPIGPEGLAGQLKRTVKAGLISRGAHGFISLLRAFETLDRGDRGGYDGNLPLNEFHKVLRTSGFNVTLEQCQALFITLGLSSGTDEADELDYGEFVNELCGEMSQQRLAMVHQAFGKFDTNNNGFVPLEDLHSGFNARKHPDVTSGARLSSQVHREFIDNFTVADAHGKVSIEAFELYFKFISACILEDADFQFMMWNVWDLHQVRAGGQVAGVGLSNVHAAGFAQARDTPNSLSISDKHGHYGRKNEFQNSIRGEIMEAQHPMRQMKMLHQERGTAGSGKNASSSSYRDQHQEILRDEYGNIYSGAHVIARLTEAGKMLGPKSWVGLTRAFQQASAADGGGGLTQHEFSAVLEAFGLGVSEKELQLIFASFDDDGDGHISYSEFMHELRGELTGQRAATVKKAWDTIDQFNRGKVVLSDLVKTFNPLADARVKNGDLTPARAVQEFMSTFDFQDSEGWITWNDFLEYYTSVSATMGDDSVFTLMVWNTWLSSRRRR